MRLICAILLVATASGAEQFQRKECLDCHQKWGEQHLGVKNLHKVVKEKKCEECHLRHGIVPKLILKESGAALCLKCHDRKSMGLDKPVLHTALKRGDCAQCHDAHGSNQPFMLKSQQPCFACHKPEQFQKKVVHEQLQKQAR